MADLRELLSQADRVPAPDLWPDIKERRPRRPDRSRRVVAGVVALALAASGIVLVSKAFLGDRERPPVPRNAAGMEVDPRITAEIPVGGSPQEIAAGEGAVWVTVNQTEASVRWFVARIDPATNQVTDEIDIPGAGDIAVGYGAVWVAGHPARDPEVDPALYRIDPGSREIVAEIPLPCGTYCAAHQVALGEGAVWVTLYNTPDSGEVVRVDPRTNEIVARIVVSGDPRDLGVGGGSVWVYALGQGGALHRIDPRTNELAASLLQGRIYSDSGDSSPPILAAGFGHVWIGVGDGDPMEVARIDPRTNEIAGEPVRLGLDEALFQPFSTEAGGVWFRGGQQGNRPLIGRLNPATLTVDETLRLDRTVVIDGAIDPGTGTMWLTNLRKTITRIDLRPDPEQPTPSEGVSDSLGAAEPPTAEVTDVLRLTKPHEGLLGSGIAVGEGSLWVPFHGPRGFDDPASILRIDPATNEVVAEIPVPVGPVDLTVGAGSVWTVGYGEGSGHVVSRIDPTANRVVATIPLPEGTSGGPIVAAEDAVWVGATGDTTGELLRLDPRTGEVVDRVAADFCNPFSARCSPNDELVIGEGALWAAGRRQGTLLRLDRPPMR
ncbi:MAG: hypothetical protein ACRDKA_06075 [Actinomycetota bacterium]